jgi:hypothetical protein
MIIRHYFREKTSYGITVIAIVLFALLFWSFLSPDGTGPVQDKTTTEANDSLRVMNDVFDIPEPIVKASPEVARSITFPVGIKISDFDVSPAGVDVAILSEKFAGRSIIYLWRLGGTKLSDSISLPSGLKGRSIVWHPLANAIFVLGERGSVYTITRIDRKGTVWSARVIYITSLPVRRLLVCPRPFVVKYDYKNKCSYYSYRLFFGMDNGDKTYRIVSVTENGGRFYQVVGPASTMSPISDQGAPPSDIVSDWALPVAFHPAGHELIWEGKYNNFRKAEYYRYWSDGKKLTIPIENNGTIMPTPNGLGFIHWKKGEPGVGIYLIAAQKEERQISSYNFITAPSSVPDGRGVVGLTFSGGTDILNYVPVTVPLADVVNAWMFTKDHNEQELFTRFNGLFRLNRGDQLYETYETENYYCNGYDKSSPTRPYLVTTDIFWELFGAAYQGLFIVKEREVAIPFFKEFVNKAGEYLKNSDPKSHWLPVFEAINDLYEGKTENVEVKRILDEIPCYTEITDDQFDYSELKPRGYYATSPELQNYFRAFKYFTTIFKTKNNRLNELNSLPDDIKKDAASWLESYSGFIAPSRSTLAWNNVSNALPVYCRHADKSTSLFPLSWGFDNEILYTDVYHEKWPEDEQIKGPIDFRLIPSGLDIASVLGSNLADNLLETDYAKYPPLRNAIIKLRANFSENVLKQVKSNNLYNEWITALSLQFEDTLSALAEKPEDDIWNVKRLQTGLASWATLRHSTVLVNERGVAECGEGGFEDIVMRDPRGYVEPDPYTFDAIGRLFELAVSYIPGDISEKNDVKMNGFRETSKTSLYDGIKTRLRDAAEEAYKFREMAKKELRGEPLTTNEFKTIMYVSRIAEHYFLIFNSLANKDYALSYPDPIAKTTDVFGGNMFPYLMASVGNPAEWDYVVPFFGRRQIVKGSVYTYYEFSSTAILNDAEWRKRVQSEQTLSWVNPYTILKGAEGMPQTSY